MSPVAPVVLELGDELDPGDELDCAEAASAPPATSADASRRVLMAFMETLRVSPLARLMHDLPLRSSIDTAKME